MYNSRVFLKRYIYSLPINSARSPTFERWSQQTKQMDVLHVDNSFYDQKKKSEPPGDEIGAEESWRTQILALVSICRNHKV